MPLENVGKIINITKKDEKIKLDFSNSWKSIVLSNEIYTDDYYYVGKELTKKEYDKIVDLIKDDKNLKYALSLCSKKLYSKKEVVDKLKSRGAEKKSIERIIKKLKEYSLIDDKKFVEEFVYCHKQKLDGRIKIEKELLEKGISSSLIKEIVFDQDEEINNASLLIHKLMEKHKNKSKIKQKEAVISSLIRKGFTYDVANISYENEITNYVVDDNERLKKALLILQNRGYENTVIIKKLLAKGYRYDDILRSLKGE